jgi:hypothetical protein
MAGLAGAAGCGGHAAPAARATGATSSAATATRAPAGADPAARHALEAAAGKVAAKRSADLTVLANLAGHRSSQTGSCTWGPGGFRIDTVDHSPSQDLRTLTHDGTVETRQIGTAVYYRVDPRPSGPLRGKHWMKIDISAYTSAAAARVTADSSADPVRQVRDLAAAPDVRRVGVETVDGRRATHYSGHVPATAEQKSVGLGEPALVDVWLGDDGMLVRYRHDVGGMEMTLDYRRFGEEPPVATPAAADTADRSAAVAAAAAKAAGKR